MVTVARGFTRGEAPAYPWARIPTEWKRQPYWMSWVPMPGGGKGKFKGMRRGLLAPTGEFAHATSPRLQSSYQAALRNAVKWDLGNNGGGICFIYRGHEPPPRGTIFFSIRPRRSKRRTRLIVLGFNEPEGRR
jgi:hypothetical protein